jgi:hypothetical protein
MSAPSSVTVYHARYQRTASTIVKFNTSMLIERLLLAICTYTVTRIFVYLYFGIIKSSIVWIMNFQQRLNLEIQDSHSCAQNQL